MSLLLKAFPQGRPSRPARTSLRPLLTVLATSVALLATLLPLAPASAAKQPRHQHHQHHHARPSAQHPHQPATKKQKKPKAPAKPAGQPPRGYVAPATSYFSYPNLGKIDRQAIRRRVLKTINSTWGGPRTSIGTPRPGNGTIRMATWSFDDWNIAHALVAARKRGVSVQIIAAKGRNKTHGAWRWLRKKLGQKLYRPGYPQTRETVSFARACRGACRGPGGTAHSKYYLFTDVGARHEPAVTFQTSMNLTYMAWQGQWNQAQVTHSRYVHADYLGIFRQSRAGRPVARPYHVKVMGPVVDYFFPRPQATAPEDPAMQVLGTTKCHGATTPGRKTRIRIDQYAIYGERGIWLAKKLRALWQAGCDVAIIYSISSRPVLSILRNPSGRGPIPMRQSIVTDSWGTIVKYNHSKWMTIIGAWGGKTAAYVTFTGSANWANLAFGDDEQMQRISSARQALRYNASFKKTWRQPSSDEPGYGRVASFGRGRAPYLTRAALLRGVPQDEPEFGRGIYRYMSRD
jgi:phosphatidylserine/phosphatidylglycerophosphate/cardiolipin synthase-like enzyme